MKHAMHNRIDALHDRQGLKLASYLHEGTADLPHDITERLRASREQALTQHQAVRLRLALRPIAAGSVTMASAQDASGDADQMSWWARAGSALPLVALALGLLVINAMQNNDRARELADIDAALLTDELPPAAFADRGFIEFLKENR